MCHLPLISQRPELLTFESVERCAGLDEHGPSWFLVLTRWVFDDLNHRELLVLIHTLDPALEAPTLGDDVAFLLHLGTQLFELLEERLPALELEHTKLLLADRLDLVEE